MGYSFSTVGDRFSTVEVVQYSGDNISPVEVARDKDLKFYEFSKDLEIFSRAYFALKSDRLQYRPQLLTTADMGKDLGYKNLVLDKIIVCTYDRPRFWKYLVKFFGDCGRIRE